MINLKLSTLEKSCTNQLSSPAFVGTIASMDKGGKKKTSVCGHGLSKDEFVMTNQGKKHDKGNGVDCFESHSTRIHHKREHRK